jgi:hypothetical protein
MTGAAVLAGGLLIAPAAFSVVEMVGYRRGHFGRRSGSRHSTPSWTTSASTAMRGG